MAQLARPSSDVSNAGGWTPDTGTALWDKLDEVTYSTSGSDHISSPSSPGSPGAVCVVGLSSLTDPAVGTGHIVRYRYAKVPNGGRQANLHVRLLQGTTEIAAWSHSAITSGVSLVEQTLSGAQADAITDYSTLRLEFRAETVGGGSASGARVYWAEMEVPDAGAQPLQRTLAVTATFTAGANRQASRFRALAATTSMTASFVRRLALALGTPSTLVAGMLPQRVFLKAMAATSALVSSLSAQIGVGRVLAAAPPLTAAMQKRVAKSLAIASALSVGFQRRVYIALAVAPLFAIEFRRAIAKALAVPASLSPALSESYVRLQALAAASSFTASLAAVFVAAGGAIKRRLLSLMGVGA